MWDFLPHPRRMVSAWPSIYLSIFLPLPQTCTQRPGQSPTSRPLTQPIGRDGSHAYSQALHAESWAKQTASTPAPAHRPQPATQQRHERLVSVSVLLVAVLFSQAVQSHHSLCWTGPKEMNSGEVQQLLCVP